MIYHTIYITMLILLSFMLLACLIRAVRGPLIADRLMAVNMMGTMVKVYIGIYEEKHHKKDSDNDHTVKGDLSDGNA